MKIKFTPTLTIVVLLTSYCLSINTTLAQTHKKTVSKPQKAPTAKKPTIAELQQGQALLSKSDCLSCHKIDIKLVGPAYKDVSAKYPATETNYTMLTQKVISGGNGVWGPVAMAPHPTIPPADVKKMIEYILSINK